MLTIILQVRQRVMARHEPGRGAVHTGAVKPSGEFGQAVQVPSELVVIPAKFHWQSGRPKRNAFGFHQRPKLRRLVVRKGSQESAIGADGFESDRKSTRLNSSHLGISYAVFCL